MKRVDRLVQRWWSGGLGPAGAALDLVLAPAEAAYRFGTVLRNRAYDRGTLRSERVDVPVISVGNIAVGGTGKTPFTSWLAVRLATRGETPVIVHGGYADDEPSLHRMWTPQLAVIVDRDRVRACRAAHAAGASVVVLDDAFQHRRLDRDLDIVLVSVERWSNDMRLLPRGPWRESPAALRRADLIVCVRKTPALLESAELAAALHASTGRPVMRVHMRASAWQHNDGDAQPPAQPALAVSGLADGATFGANARAAGANVVEQLIYPDHHEYDERDVTRITKAAESRAIVTSAKDWTKLRTRLAREQVWILKQSLAVDAGLELLDTALDGLLR